MIAALLSVFFAWWCQLAASNRGILLVWGKIQQIYQEFPLFTPASLCGSFISHTGLT